MIHILIFLMKLHQGVGVVEIGQHKNLLVKDSKRVDLYPRSLSSTRTGEDIGVTVRVTDVCHSTFYLLTPVHPDLEVPDSPNTIT